ATPARAAAKRCDWHGPLSGGEKPYAKCVDFASMEGKTIALPKNVTRIAADGISFCVPPTPTTGAGDADIVFIYDNSGSMTADAFYVGPGGDTAFYYLDGNSNCSRNTVLGTPLVNTKTGPVAMIQFASNTGCNSAAGDPYNARGTVIKAGIDFLGQTSPTSTGAAISFNEDIKYLQPPVLMNATGVAAVKASITLDTNGGTSYGPPLRKAKEWFGDATLMKTKKKAIIFISDGAPHDNYNDVLTDDMPPIFSIYLSKANTRDTANLKELADETGGTFTRVNSNDPAAIEALLKSIISTITKNTLPKSATISNKTQSPPQISRSTGVTANPDGSAGMQLDSIIGLKEGPNQIEISLVREDNTTLNYHFTMNVSAGEIGSSSGNYTCWDMPTLAAIDKKTNLPVEIYAPNNNAYDLKLTRSPSELKNVTVTAASTDDDKESISLTTLNNNLGFPTQTGGFSYNPAEGDPGLNNGILEVDDHGDFTFNWFHPRDARENVTFVLPGRIIPVISGDPTLKIQKPVTEGVTFDPVKIPNQVIVLDAKDRCIVNCKGTESFHGDGGAPTWNITIKSPFRFSCKVFDNFGQFVSNSEGELSAKEWGALGKNGDSAVVHFKIVPVSKDGQQLGTGAYLMMTTISALGDEVTKNSAGETIIVKNAKREYLRKFGYVRK
ncbi:MAG: vWA domain-containing protein, partial [Fibrobacteria bacterium]